ncbi:MAG: outer membrane lipoprotein-sorting protein [Arcobacteraceae bacterium]|nr:outer membrane lipoprotein-sorting protein [Arcobacteraceae bacterium]
MLKKLVVSLVVSVGLYAQSSVEIAKKSYEIMSGYKSSISQTTMILKNSDGEENIRKLEIKKLENINGDKSLIKFLYPADIKDTKLLSYEIIGSDDQQWLYLPALKRIKRISSRNKSGSFMASEFSYEDIASQNYKNYTYDEKVENTTKDGKKYFKITRIPKDENSGYSKQFIWIDSTTYLATFGEYYDKQNRLLKEISFLEYQKIQNIYRIKKINMFNVQNGKSSILSWDEDKIKLSLDVNDFTQRVLQ